MPFLTNSDADIKEMLSSIGVENFESLISNIPDSLRFKSKINIPSSISEAEIINHIGSLTKNNKLGVSFMGGGVYDHYVPAIVDSLLSRSEFYTAYTPYQPEISQGTLQSIYEFQSMVCELSGMDVTNASMYEGGSALAEAMLLACTHTKKQKVLVAGSLNPRYKAVLQTYINHNDIRIEELSGTDFAIDIDVLEEVLDDECAAVILQQPNYFGNLEDTKRIGKLLRERKALFIAFYDPISLGLIAPPGEYSADIAVAEGQVLGNHQNYGGPFIGLFSTTKELVRKIPGRISGKTKDLEQKPGFVLTLQTREQHIRREKATSNICTNSGLLALAATIYLAAMGKNGLKEVANLCLQKSHYLAENLKSIKGVELAGTGAFFKEFVVRLPIKTEIVLKKLADKNIFGGIDLQVTGHPDHLLIAVTEKRTKEEMDDYVRALREVLGLLQI